MLLLFASEHDLPLSIVPDLKNLGLALSHDIHALRAAQVHRTTASYKIDEGICYKITKDLVEHLKQNPFNLTIDEAPTSSHKKVLAFLVSFVNEWTKTLEVHHLKSVEVRYLIYWR